MLAISWQNLKDNARSQSSRYISFFSALLSRLINRYGSIKTIDWNSLMQTPPLVQTLPRLVVCKDVRTCTLLVKSNSTCRQSSARLLTMVLLGLNWEFCIGLKWNFFQLYVKFIWWLFSSLFERKWFNVKKFSKFLDSNPLGCSINDITPSKCCKLWNRVQVRTPMAWRASVIQILVGRTRMRKVCTWSLFQIVSPQLLQFTVQQKNYTSFLKY